MLISFPKRYIFFSGNIYMGSRNSLVAQWNGKFHKNINILNHNNKNVNKTTSHLINAK